MTLSIDGQRVGVQELPGDGAPVVLVHGAGMDGRVFDALAPRLAEAGRRVVALDLPGHGASEGAALPSVAAAADWLGRAVEALDAAPALLGGHSYGALIVLDLAARRPELASGLVLMGVAERMTVNEGLLAQAASDPAAAAGLVAGWCHGVSRKEDPDGAAEWTGRILALMDRARPESLAADLAACNDYTDAAARAAAVSCPARLILGGRDKMTPPVGGHALADAFRSAAVSDVACGHMMMLEAPDDTARLVLEAP